MMSLFDYMVLGLCLLAMLFVGFFLKSRERGANEFFVAGGAIKWWPMGLSIMATAFSVVNYVAFPEEAIGHGLYVWLVFPALFLSGVIVCFWIMPFYHKTSRVSAYEFLECRFDLRVRRLAAVIFILWRIAWMSLVLYAAGSLLEAVSGVSFWLVVAACSFIAVLYTVSGGIRAIIRTDVLQFLVIMAGIVLAVIIVVNERSFSDVFRSAFEAGRLRPFAPADSAIWSFNPFVRMSVWSCLIGGTTAFLARYGVDQVVVQRYFTVCSLRAAQKGFILNLILLSVALFFLTFLGLAVVGYQPENAGQVGVSRYPVKFIASFMASLPRGAVGLIVAGLVASAMSSLDSAMHSCATSLVVDFGFFSKNASDSMVVRRAKLFTLSFGIIALVMTLVVKQAGTIFEVANKVVNALGSPILALFVLAWLRGVNFSSKGVFIGGVLGAVFSVYLSFFVKGLALHYYAFINFAATLFFAGVLGLALRCEKDRKHEEEFHGRAGLE